MKLWTVVANNLNTALSRTEKPAQQQTPSGRELLRRFTGPVRDIKPRQMGSFAKKLFSNFSSNKGGYSRPSDASPPFARQAPEQTPPGWGSARRSDSGYASQEYRPPFGKPGAQQAQHPPPLPPRPARVHPQPGANASGQMDTARVFPATPPTPPDSGYGGSSSEASFARPVPVPPAPVVTPPVSVQRQIATFRPEQHILDVEHSVAATLERDLSEAKRAGVLRASSFLAIRDSCARHAINDLKSRFEQGKQQLAHFPAQQKAERRQRLDQEYAQAYERVVQAVDQICRKHGFAIGDTSGNVKWEDTLLLKQGLNLSNLELAKADISSGAFGSVSIFKTGDQAQVIGKISKNNMRDPQGNVIDDLGMELAAYKRVYETVGPHPNLVNAYGIAQVQKNGKTERAMLMDAIPGPDGDKAFQALRKCWDSGKISSSQYWGAMQFMARRLLDVSGHLNEAGIAHRDIKPPNFLVNEKTGEPILIDLGLWAEHGSRGAAGTPGYMAPELPEGAGVDHTADTFSVGATMVDGIEGGYVRAVVSENGTTQYLTPDAGVARQQFHVPNPDGSWTRKAGARIDTDHTRFFEATMAAEREKRFDPAKARKELAILDTHEITPEVALDIIKNAQVPAFLSHSLLDDDDAKEVVKNALKMAKEENAKPAGEQWKVIQKEEPISRARNEETRDLLARLRQNPNLATFGTLHNYSKTDKELKTYLDEGSLIRSVRPALERHADSFATSLLANTGWFGAVDRAARSIKVRATPSNAPASEHEKQERNRQLSREAGRIKREIGSTVSDEYLRQYADQAEAFLRSVDGLPGGVHDPRIAEKIEQVRQHAAAAREVATLMEAGTPEPVLSVRDLRRRLENSDKLNRKFETISSVPPQATELLHRLSKTPDLATYAALHEQARHDPKIKAELDKAVTPAAVSAMQRDAHAFVSGLLANAPWFDAVDDIAKNLPPPALLVGGGNNPQLMRAKAEIGGATTLEQLRGYQEQIGTLLRDCDVLPGAKSPMLEAGIARLNRRAAVLADVLALMDATARA